MSTQTPDLPGRVAGDEPAPATAGRPISRLDIVADALGSDAPHVVIVGAGFAGLAVADSIGSTSIRVTIIDRKNCHLFQPLLYLVATAVLSPGEIAEPIRRLLSRHKNVTVLLGGVDAVRSRGDLAVVSRNAAVIAFDRVKLKGFLAWLLWGVVHVYLLVGFQNRFPVTMRWLWAYLTLQRGARIISPERSPEGGG